VKDYGRELAPGQSALRRSATWPDLTGALRDRVALTEQVERSLNYLSKPSSKGFFPQAGISHEQCQKSLLAFRDLLVSDLGDAQVLARLQADFEPWESVGCDGEGTVLFTGYYTPVFAASLERTDVFRYPLHRLPPNHVKDPRTGETKGLRRQDGSLDPNYPDRAGLLASGALEGQELCWLADPFEAYVTQVQGSALLRLRDGSELEVGYAGSNGREYRSIGQELIRQGKLRREDLSLQKLLHYFRDHPEELEPLLATNERYVFFQESQGGPYGCINERVVPLRSIATDKSIFPRGALCFVSAPLPVGVGGPGGHRGFALDQDAGGAIRAPGRCDVYMGAGEEAGLLAGRTWAEGKLYYLFLKEDGAREVSSAR
jgi:membrane-bound lytic murein transglycosylase A